MRPDVHDFTWNLKPVACPLKAAELLVAVSERSSGRGDKFNSSDEPAQKHAGIRQTRSA